MTRRRPSGPAAAPRPGGIPPRMLTPAEYNDRIARTMSEATLQAKVEGQARELGWLAYHTHDSRRSVAGFPDLVMVHPRQRRTLYRELKRETEHPTDAQRKWLDALTAADEDAAVWRPSDLFSGLITATLIGRQADL